MKLADLIAEMEKSGCLSQTSSESKKNAAKNILSMAEDMKALHGVDAANEVAVSAAHSYGLGREFANAVMARLKEDSPVKKIFRPEPIHEEWLGPIAALEDFMRRVVGYFEWLDEIMMGQLHIAWHDYAVGEEIDVTTTREFILSLEPCSAEFFTKMGIEERAPLAIDAYMGKKGVRLFVDMGAIPKIFCDWLGEWAREKAYDRCYRERNWGLHDNHRQPREFDLHKDAVYLYSQAKLELEKQNPLSRLVGTDSNERGKEMTGWVENKLLGTSPQT